MLRMNFPGKAYSLQRRPVIVTASTNLPSKIIERATISSRHQQRRKRMKLDKIIPSLTSPWKTRNLKIPPSEETSWPNCQGFLVESTSTFPQKISKKSYLLKIPPLLNWLANDKSPCGITATLLAIDLRDIIPDIKIPVLIIHGEKDNACIKTLHL